MFKLSGVFVGWWKNNTNKVAGLQEIAYFKARSYLDAQSRGGEWKLIPKAPDYRRLENDTKIQRNEIEEA